MKEIWQARWQRLAPRERRVISWGGAGLLAAMLYAYLWQPVTAERHKLRASIPQLRASAAQMQRQAREAAQLKASLTPTPQGEAIMTAIHQAANEAGLDAKNVQVNTLDEGRANISLAAVPFNTWAMLVANLQKHQGIRLEFCIINALPERGMTSVRAIVRVTD